jgi:hypothetical protein
MSLSDRSKTIGDLLEALRLFYPHYKWSSKIHSNMIRGTTEDSCYNIMIVYFQLQKIFEVCVRGADINCRVHSKDIVEGMKELKKELESKKKTIEEIIASLNEKELEK